MQKADDYYDKVIARFEEDGDRQSVLLIDTYTSKPSPCLIWKDMKKHISSARKPKR